jgi:hypothetical protein
MATALWVIYDIALGIVGFWFLERKLTRNENIAITGLVLMGLVIAIYSGYSDYQTSMQMTSLEKGQEFTKGQLDTIAKMLGSSKAVPAESTPSVLLLASSGRLNLFNKSAQDLQLWGNKFDATPADIGGVRVIPKDAYYYFLTDKLKAWALATIGKTGEKLIPFEVYLSDSHGQQYIAKFDLLIVMDRGDMTIHTQQLGVVAAN